VGAGQVRAHAGLAEPVDRLPVQAVGGFTVAQQRLGPLLDPQSPVGPASLGPVRQLAEGPLERVERALVSLAQGLSEFSDRVQLVRTVAVSIVDEDSALLVARTIKSSALPSMSADSEESDEASNPPDLSQVIAIEAQIVLTGDLCALAGAIICELNQRNGLRVESIVGVPEFVTRIEITRQLCEEIQAIIQSNLRLAPGDLAPFLEQHARRAQSAPLLVFCIAVHATDWPLDVVRDAAREFPGFVFLLLTGHDRTIRESIAKSGVPVIVPRYPTEDEPSVSEKEYVNTYNYVLNIVR